MLSDMHVMPVDDLIIHEMIRTCQCDPTFEDENGKIQDIGTKPPVLVIHNAADGRD